MEKIPVELTESELSQLAALAKKRNDNKEKHSVRTRKVDDQMTDEELHYIGLKGELAVAKLLGVDFSIDNILSGDGGSDIVYRGLTVDVKYSQLDFKFRPGTFVADIAILTQPLSSGTWTYAGKTVTAEPDNRVAKKIFAWTSVLVVGWVSRERFEAEHIMKNFGYNDVEFMPARDLSPMRGLRSYAETNTKNPKAN